MEKIKRWIYRPIGEGELFFTRIRYAYRFFFPCKHSWVSIKPHGQIRCCRFCGLLQKKIYKRIGMIRYIWRNFYCINPDKIEKEFDSIKERPRR